MKRLTINGQEADISELPSAISFKYVDIIDGLSNRYSPFTSGITLPYTARNKSIFGYSDVVGGSKKVNPNLIADGYRHITSSTSDYPVWTAIPITLEAGKTYTLSTRGKKLSGEGSLRVYIWREVAGVWYEVSYIEITATSDTVGSLNFTVGTGGTWYVNAYNFPAEAGGSVYWEWVMLQEGNVYIDQNTTFKQTALEDVSNKENLLENSVEIYEPSNSSNFHWVDIAGTTAGYRYQLLYGYLYTFTIEDSELSSGTTYSARLYNFTTNANVVAWTFTTGQKNSGTFRVPSGSDNIRLIVNTGIDGATAGVSATFYRLMLQYGPFSTKWYKYGITPTVIPISAERGISMVDLFIGGLKVIDQGSLTLDSMDGDGYHCTINSRNTLIDSIEALKVEDVMDEIQGDADIFNTASLAVLLPVLVDGSLGVMLVRDLQENITSTTWGIMTKQVAKNFIHHWLWFSVNKLFSTLETMCGFSFYFTEGGALVDLSTSTLAATYLTKLWTPGFAYFVDMNTSTGACSMGKDISDTNQFHFGTEDEVPRSTFKAFGDKTAWDMVKIVSNMFCCGLKVSAKDSTVIFYPLDEIKNFDSIDLSGRLTERPEKIPFIEGYTSTSRIRFTVSDNAPEDYNEIVLTSPKLPAETTDLYTLDLLVPGLYYNAILDDNVFKLNIAANDMLNSVPLILYQNGDVEATTVEYTIPGTTYSYSADLEKLRMLDLSTFHGDLQAWLTKGLLYNIKIAISVYDYMKLRPYRFVRIKELGGDYYLNKIDKWNPDKEAKMQLIKADTAVVKVMPTLTWNTPADIFYGTALSSTQLNCTADVAGTFTYTPAAGEVLNAGTHTLSVMFVPTDTDAYEIAYKTVDLLVKKVKATVTWATPSAITYGTALSVTQLNATANTPGSFVYDPPAGTILNAGTNNLDVTFTPYDTTNYTGDTENVDLVVNKATPAITWADPATITYGTPLSSTQLNATANTPGAFTYNPTFGAIPNAGTNTLNVSFVPTDTANWNNASDTASLVINKATPTLSSWVPSPTDIDNGSNWAAGQLNASFSVAGTITYKYYGTSDPVTAGTTLAVGVEEETVVLQAHLAPTDSTNYNAVDLPQLGKSFNVNQARCTLDPDYNNEDGAITFVGIGQHSDSITLETTEGYVLSLESGSGFTIKVNNNTITLPYTGTAGTPTINISGSFSAIDKTEVFKISPSSGYALVPIYLTCRYYKEIPHP